MHVVGDAEILVPRDSALAVRLFVLPLLQLCQEPGGVAGPTDAVFICCKALRSAARVGVIMTRHVLLFHPRDVGLGQRFGHEVGGFIAIVPSSSSSMIPDTKPPAPTRFWLFITLGRGTIRSQAT